MLIEDHIVVTIHIFIKEKASTFFCICSILILVASKKLLKRKMCIDDIIGVDRFLTSVCFVELYDTNVHVIKLFVHISLATVKTPVSKRYSHHRILYLTANIRNNRTNFHHFFLPKFSKCILFINL